MEEKENRLKIAFNYLRKKKLVRYQRDVARIMNVNEVTVSRAFAGIESYCNKQFLLNFNACFDNVFSVKWLLGEDVPMLAAPPVEDKSPEVDIVNLAATLIKEVEALRLQLNEELDATRLVREELSSTCSELSQIIATIKTSSSSSSYGMIAAENILNSKEKV